MTAGTYDEAHIANREHNVPQVDGGTWRLWNLQLMDRTANAEKSNGKSLDCATSDEPMASVAVLNGLFVTLSDALSGRVATPSRMTRKTMMMLLDMCHDEIADAIRQENVIKRDMSEWK